MLKSSVETILSIDAGMFPAFETQEGMDALSLFSSEDIRVIKAKIQAYQSVKAAGSSAAGARTGGSALLKELEKVESFKAGLFSHLAEIHKILAPKPMTRTTIKSAEQATQQAAIQGVAASYTGLPEKLLRQLAEAQLGDMQLTYLAEELPLLLATKQVTGTF